MSLVRESSNKLSINLAPHLMRISLVQDPYNTKSGPFYRISIDQYAKSILVPWDGHGDNC